MSATEPPLAPRALLRWETVRPLISEIEPGSILELGCGLGSVGVRLARMSNYTALEPDAESFAVASRHILPAGGQVLHGDHTAAPTGQRYDLVCAFEVLEHIADDAGALDDWMALVQPGGHLLLSVPADPEHFGPFDEAVGHYRRYTAEQLGQLLAETGATDIVLTHYGWPLGYLLDTVRDSLVVARRKRVAGSTPQQRTHASGRIWQPARAEMGPIIRTALWPFIALQRWRPDRGPGLVALATRPVEGTESPAAVDAQGTLDL
jgi:SAM-dependent methyltransferase